MPSQEFSAFWTLITCAVGSVVGAAWWASKISAGIQNLTLMVEKLVANQSGLTERLQVLERKVEVLEFIVEGGKK